jgi:drug/metabolite transporter (DMT)-like permease
MLTAAAAAIFERQPMVWSGEQAAGVAASALIATVAAYLLFYWLLLQIGPAKLAMLQWVQLLVAAAESVIVTAARPGWELLVGVILIAVAVRRAWAAPDEEQGVMLQITRP